MEEKVEIKISVRNLVEFILRSGDLDARFMSSTRAVEGTRIHQKLQKLNKKKYGEMGMEYNPEMVLIHRFEYNGIPFVVEGRADGIIVPMKENELFMKVIVDEIKTTTLSLEDLEEEYNNLHWAQAKCYAYIYALQNGNTEMDVQLTYCDIENEDIKIFIKNLSFSELEGFFTDIIEKYYRWAELSENWSRKRDGSIRSLGFPFEKYRKGQRELAVSVYRTIVEGKRIFIQAPTGIGKTISTLFPSVKAVGEGLVSKIFYLTAKTITRQVAEEAVRRMRDGGLSLKSITLTAKDKICFNKGSACNPEACSYAKGHFDRVNRAIEDILINEDDITRNKLEYYAAKHSVCPFEYSLDLTLWCDCIICDYNYVFDPRVNLKRFFEGKGDFAFLVDEAHNLVDRAREMYSAELSKRDFLKLKKSMKYLDSGIAKILGKLNTYMLSLKKELAEEDFYVQEGLPEEMYPLLRKFTKASEEWLGKNEGREAHEDLLQLYFDVMAFLRIWELYDKRFVTYIEEAEGDLKIKLFCLHPGNLIDQSLQKGRAAVLFSATLMPMNYFKDILGGGEEAYSVKLTSPFPMENQCLLVVDSVSTRYRHRDKSVSDVADYIHEFVAEKTGNYMVFFPSYKYLTGVYNRFAELYPEVRVMLQQGEMDEAQRDEFLEAFQEGTQETLAAFVVLGGIFSEGIDLKGERLIGAVIVGVGLPQICIERNIIKDYFDAEKSRGYDYSYTYPGMNKVLQAAGRVVRSDDDRGAILLIDDRFSTVSYRGLFPEHWKNAKRIRNTKEMKMMLEAFWHHTVEGEDFNEIQDEF
ncbi:MAG: ATP-dependent DNA helicase [Bacillota bacterium]|nr:ATP-dependent DNA helicase [Bacillota bacterium]